MRTKTCWFCGEAVENEYILQPVTFAGEANPYDGDFVALHLHCYDAPPKPRGCP